MSKEALAINSYTPKFMALVVTYAIVYPARYFSILHRYIRKHGPMIPGKDAYTASVKFPASEKGQFVHRYYNRSLTFQ